MQIMTSIRAASVAIALSLGFAAAANATTISTVEDYSAYNSGPPNSNAQYAGDASQGSISRIYDRFLLPTYTAGTNISSATFTITSTSRWNSASNPLGLFEVVNDSWTVTDWANKPALGTKIATFNPGQRSTAVSIDVTAFINSQYAGDGKASFAIAGNTEGAGKNSWTYFLNNARLTYTLGAAANAVPEPTSIALLGLGLAGIASLRRRKQ